MNELTPIIKLGNPILRQKAAAVENVQSQEIQNLIDELITSVSQANGVGIAAPQIASSYRLFIVASRPNARYPHAPEMHPTAMINPRIIAHSSEMLKDWEGCLSVPGLRGMVSRFTRLRYRGVDQYGKPIDRTVEGFHARVVQHECDHLQGILYPMRITDFRLFGYTEVLFPGQMLVDE